MLRRGNKQFKSANGNASAFPYIELKQRLRQLEPNQIFESPQTIKNLLFRIMIWKAEHPQ